MNFRSIGRREKGLLPKCTGQKEMGFMKHKIGHEMVPLVAAGFKISSALLSITQIVRSGQGGIPLAPGLLYRPEDTFVKTVQVQLIFELLIILVAGSGIQLTEKRQYNEQRY